MKQWWHNLNPKTLIVWVLIFGMTDIVTTVFALKGYPDDFQEINIMLQWVITTFGWYITIPFMIFTKVAFTFLPYVLSNLNARKILWIWLLLINSSATINNCINLYQFFSGR